MKLCTFRRSADPQLLPGVVSGDEVRRLAAASLIAYLAGGLSARAMESYRLGEVTLLAPIPEPPSIRDFFAFEQHVATTRSRRGQPVPEFWYEAPVFYFTNPAAVSGPDVPVPYPAGTSMLDYELEVAAVIGADERIAGFTVLNDWSARDLQRTETTVGLGPAKGKDFATSMGPVLVTADEFDGRAGVMTATVNGTELSRGDLAAMHYGWEELRRRAVENTRLRPGDVLGSGTVGTGCILEQQTQNWLRPGDVVELTVAGIGTLRNTIGPPRTPEVAL
jgi:fumarylacetoacetate (FAA) hydrolase